MPTATTSCGTATARGAAKAPLLRARQRLDQRREVGAGVGEEEVDAATRERGEICLGDGGQCDRSRLIHGGAGRRVAVIGVVRDGSTGV